MINEKSCVIYHKMLFNFVTTRTYDFYGENLSSKANKTFSSKKYKLIGKIYLYSRLLKYLISSNGEKTEYNLILLLVGIFISNFVRNKNVSITTFLKGKNRVQKQEYKKSNSIRCVLWSYRVSTLIKHYVSF